MIQNLHIRRMVPADLEDVTAIAARLPDAPKWPLLVYESALDARSRPERLCLVSELPGSGPAPASRLVGFLVASFVPPQAEIESIAVAPEWQRQGIARAILDFALKEFQQKGIRDVLLEVRASNLAARALYRSAGFQESGRRRGYYSEPADDAVLMTRSLIAVA